MPRESPPYIKVRLEKMVETPDISSEVESIKRREQIKIEKREKKGHALKIALLMFLAFISIGGYFILSELQITTNSQSPKTFKGKLVLDF